MDEEEARAAAVPRILVGVDGSPDGVRALRYAMRQAQYSGGDLWVVNVVDDQAPVSDLWELVSTPQTLRQAGEAKVADALRVLADEGFPTERTRAEVLVGSPGAVLGALSGGAALMVVGRRSMSGLERMFVGSTSLAAAMRAECPVIVISAASTPHRTGGLRAVAVAVGSRSIPGSALEWGIREAEARKAHLRLVHVAPETVGVEGGEFVRAAATDLEHQLGNLREGHPGVSMEVELLLGDPVDALVEVTKSVDLLILGVRHRRGVVGGSIRGVLAHAHCPVGLIKQDRS